MKNNIFCTIIICTLSATLSAQLNLQNEVLSTAGNTFISGSYVVDFTLGEVFTSTLNDGGTFVYTQGFQQPSRKKFGILDPILVSLDEQVEPGFSVFPNPFRKELSIEFPHSGSVFIQIYDNTGRSVYNDQLSDVLNTIDLSILAVGNYQLVLQTNEALLGRISVIKSH